MLTPDQLIQANALRPGTLMEALDIVFVPAGADEVAATMPVGPRTHQPMGLLHGGATVALAESLGSASSYLLVDHERQAVVGIEVNANHIKSVRNGVVKAIGRLVHRGRATHVWDIRVVNESGDLVAVCRITNMIIDRKA
ncbi:MAG: hotdog fold thioesterase [Flavobacteriales bacterium]|nr:hotdog fold thioesterase [Flavobacteriales bacterium]